MGTTKSRGRVRGKRRGGGVSCARNCGSLCFGTEQCSCLGQTRAIAGTEQAVIAHLNKSRRQDVLQETADELLGRDAGRLDLFSSGVFVFESDIAVVECDEAAITERDAKDVRREIFAGGAAIADRLAINYPVFPPNARVYLGGEPSLIQPVPDFGAEDQSEGPAVDQEVRPD